MGVLPSVLYEYLSVIVKPTKQGSYGLCHEKTNVCVCVCVCVQSRFTYILESNPHPNLIRTSFADFLNEKKVSSRF